MNESAIISARGLTVGYRRKPILSNLDFDISSGRLIALVGRNGVGKSTLLRTLTSDLAPLGGTLTLMGKPLADYRPRELASRIAVVTTEPLQVGALKVAELVSLGRDPHTGFTGRLSTSDRSIVDRAMEATGIAFKADSYVAHLSDGERQKALIARALAQDTPVIVLDEPFSFLDVAARIDILRTLTELCHTSHRAILYSSHDIAQALRMADLVWMLTPTGKLITGSPAELIAGNQIDSLFDDANVRFDATQNDFISSQI